MDLKIPILNAVNFGVIFGMLYYLGLIINNIEIIIPLFVIIGFIIGFLFEIIFKKKEKQKPLVQEKITDFSKNKLNNYPTNKKNIKRPILVSSILVILIAMSLFYFVGDDLTLNFSGQTIKEESAPEEENIEEEIIQEDEIIEEKVGHCEKQTIKRLFHQEAKDYYTEMVWSSTGHDCNTDQDCYDIFLKFDLEYEEDELRCNLEVN